MALFMENIISISGMNILLVIVLIVGIISLVMAQRSPLTVKSRPKDGLEQATCFKQDWNDLSIWSIGIVFAFVYRSGVSSGLS